MHLAILGGGGFRTPLIYRALLEEPGLVTAITLYDVDPGRLSVIEAILGQLGAQSPELATIPALRATTDLDTAIEGADFVFSAIRAGGLAGRVADERVALDLGVLGQETTGPGGIAFGLRTVPVMVDIAERIKRLAPGAWVINFTNPAGMITEAMQTVLGDRVVGICDSPMVLARRVHRAVGLPDSPVGDYAGLNHLGWLHSVTDNAGVDRLPDLLAQPEVLATLEEGQLFGAEWLQTLGAIPNEYLYYFYCTREAIASTTARTRGEFLLEQQSAFFETVTACPDCALSEWNRVRRERNETYMASARGDDTERDETDIEDGGYEIVATAVMRALAGGPPAELIVNTANGAAAQANSSGSVAIAGLGPDAVVEVPCRVTTAGIEPLGVDRVLVGDELGLVHQIKRVETLTIAAALEGSERLAIQAFGLHPLVDSLSVARQLLAGYRQRIPALDSVFRT